MVSDKGKEPIMKVLKLVITPDYITRGTNVTFHTFEQTSLILS